MTEGKKQKQKKMVDGEVREEKEKENEIAWMLEERRADGVHLKEKLDLRGPVHQEFPKGLCW